MDTNAFIIRHSQSGLLEKIASTVNLEVALINAGDGSHAHPSQALLDMLTIRQHKVDFTKLTVAIIGDVAHSRVARSQIHALSLLETKEIRVIGPEVLLPNDLKNLNVTVFHDLESGLDDADVVIVLRLQKERMPKEIIPDENTYHKLFGLTSKRIKFAKPDAIIMHPGPMNRGVEIDSDVADGNQSLVLAQVANGLKVRMALLSWLLLR